MANTPKSSDADDHKGAIEDDRPGTNNQNSLTGQLVHRGPQKPEDGEDTDFPEPGSNPEHSGEHA